MEKKHTRFKPAKRIGANEPAGCSPIGCQARKWLFHAPNRSLHGTSADNFWLVCAYGVGVTIEQFIEIAQADAQQSKMENNQTTHTQSNISAV